MGNPLLSKVLWHQDGTHFFITVYNQLTTITNIPLTLNFSVLQQYNRFKREEKEKRYCRMA